MEKNLDTTKLRYGELASPLTLRYLEVPLQQTISSQVVRNNLKKLRNDSTIFLTDKSLWRMLLKSVTNKCALLNLNFSQKKGSRKF